MASTDINTSCPYCGAVFDTATGIEERRPKKGSVSICITCFKPSVFDESLQLHELDIRTLSPLQADMIRKLIRECRAVLARHQAKSN